MAVSDTPWGNFTDADYSDEQYARACILDRGADAGTPKARYGLRVREPDGTLNRNGVHAAAQRLSAVRGASQAQIQAAARKLVTLYRSDLGEEPPDSVLSAAGMATSSARSLLEDVDLPYGRTVHLDDVTVRTEAGGGRVVEAYAAIFDKGYDISDADGQYTEVLDPTCFNMAIGLARSSGRAFPVLYNHGLTMHGTPDPEGSIPIGVADEVKADRKGLFTRTRFHNTARADNVLEGIEKGSITGYSFSGIFRKSDPPRRGGRYRGQTVRRMESTLREFGPALFPANPAAEIVGVRMEQMLALLLGTPPLGEPDGDAAAPDDDQPVGQSAQTPHQRLVANRARFLAKYGG
jgi:HK97 family phage prohead protease